MDSGALVDFMNASVGTPLVEAARAGHVATVVALVERGATVNVQNFQHETPLIAAAAAGRPAVGRCKFNRSNPCSSYQTHVDPIKPMFTPSSPR